MRFSLSPHFFSVSLLYSLYNGYLTWPWLPGPIHHVHPSSVQGGCWRYYTLTYNYFPKFDIPVLRTLPQMRIFSLENIPLQNRAFLFSSESITLNYTSGSHSCMETLVLSPVVACVSLNSTHVSQLTDDCMDQLTRTRWKLTPVSVSECLDLSRSLLWHISYSCSLYLL